MELKKIKFEPDTIFDFSRKCPKELCKMPLVKIWVKKKKKHVKLNELTVLLIQHQFLNQIILVKALHKLGVPFENMLWLDIPYTSSKKIRAKLMKLGIPENNLFVSKYDVTLPYIDYQRARVQKLYAHLLETQPKSLLVLDDGAYFIEALSTFKKRLPNICIVEQTARGLIKISDNSTLKFLSRTLPIVDVATSNPKIRVEAPFIGISINSALHESLKNIKEDLQSWKCLVLGYGAVGSNVARFLKDSLTIQKKNTFVFDTEKKRITKARKEGYNIWDRNDFETRFNLVIGCSGRTSFKVGDAIYLENNSILVSASSGSSELSRQEFIELADSSQLDDIIFLKKGIRKKNVHMQLDFSILDKRVTFLNGGFPINFNGVQEGIPNRFIQATILMMLQGSVQAIKALESNRTGIIKLHSGFCKKLCKEFSEELKNRGYSIN
jgi:S-adenosylhomocysteine hydrolase